MKEKTSEIGISPSALIDAQISDLSDWRGKTLAQLRSLILEAVPEISEAWKWSTATWVYRKPVCAAGVFKDHVKLNFFKGASLNDPQGLFNAGLEAKTSRAVDFYQDDAIDASALHDLIRAAVAQNSE